MFQSIVCLSKPRFRALAIFLAIALALTIKPNISQAQFGGLQDYQLQKMWQQQQSSNNQPTTPSQANGNNGQPQVNNNYYIRVPGYLPYGNYNGYPYQNPYYADPYANPYANPYGYSYNQGYGGYYGNPYSNGPTAYQPSITVVPFGTGLSSGALNGAYATPLVPRNSFGNSLPSVANSRPVQPPIAVEPPVNAQPPAPEDEITRRVAALKPSTDGGRLRSDELIADGDREFVAQEYRHAAAKYRDAIAKAPDYSPAHLRAGHAYIATGDYELAVTYFAMGFELSRTIERPGFSLADLYRGNALAKEQHSESLADAVLRQPQDGGLLFLTGLMQHYDGHPLQARDYFRRAAEMPGRHQPYASMFLPKPAVVTGKPEN